MAAEFNNKTSIFYHEGIPGYLIVSRHSYLEEDGCSRALGHMSKDFMYNPNWAVLAEDL
jgi:hypothetical protein